MWCRYVARSTHCSSTFCCLGLNFTASRRVRFSFNHAVLGNLPFFSPNSPFETRFPVSILILFPFPTSFQARYRSIIIHHKPRACYECSRDCELDAVPFELIFTCFDSGRTGVFNFSITPRIWLLMDGCEQGISVVRWFFEQFLMDCSSFAI